MTSAQASTQTKLPRTARCFFEAVARSDVNALADCFASDAYVIDVDRRIEGREVIREWARSEVIGGRYEILEVIKQGDGADVLLTFTPAAMTPFRARYRMRFRGGKVISMDLQYA